MLKLHLYKDRGKVEGHIKKCQYAPNNDYILF